MKARYYGQCYLCRLLKELVAQIKFDGSELQLICEECEEEVIIINAEQTV